MNNNKPTPQEKATSDFLSDASTPFKDEYIEEISEVTKRILSKWGDSGIPREILTVDTSLVLCDVMLCGLLALDKALNSNFTDEVVNAHLPKRMELLKEKFLD